MGVAFDIRNGTCLLTLSGEYDRANVDELASDIKGCFGSAPSVLLDFQEVTFVDGAVLSLLHDVLERMSNRGRLGIARALPRMEDLLRIAGLTKRSNFQVFSSLEEAFQAISEG